MAVPLCRFLRTTLRYRTALGVMVLTAAASPLPGQDRDWHVISGNVASGGAE